MFAAIAARWALAGGFKGVVKMVPRWVWYVIIAGLVILAGLWWHGRQVKVFGNERFAAGYAKAVDDGKKLAARLDAKGVTVATEIRSKTDETIRDNARRADTLRLRGPGAAACLNPGLPAGAGRRQPPGGQPAPARAGVPDQDRIALPFGWAVDRAEIADANRAEVIAWRDWHQRLSDEWAKLRKEADGVRAEP